LHTQHTITRLRALRLEGMARAFEEQLLQPAAQSLSFEERFGLLVDRETSWRDSKRIARLLKVAKLKVSSASIEDIDYRPNRGLDKRLVSTLASCDWIRHAQNLILVGATGTGKTWLCCAFGQAACRQGFSTVYLRASRLLEELRIAHGDGSFARKLSALARTDLIVIDDWAQVSLTHNDRANLLEVLDDRVNTRSTLITSQLPVDTWHEYLADPTLADAILDRLVHHSHRIALKGESMRKREPK
jgi:DNA replication protein DnaC